MGLFISKPSAWEYFPESLRRNQKDLLYLQTEADRWIKINPVSVADKANTDHGGDARDYVSQAPYWWPDPEKPDGRPYVRRDGEENPEIHRSDRARLEAFRDAVTCLVLRSQLADSVPYAEHAGRFLRRWFLDPGTGMNPHLRYAQFIPGVCEGRSIGLIDTAFFCFLLDEIGHLPFSAAWTPEDLRELQQWFGAYLDWFLESDHGKRESQEHNNHGTWYDAQVVCFARFCGRDGLAKEWLEKTTLPRLAAQISSDSSQPHELARTLSLTYCTFNLTGFCFLARTAEQAGLDLWRERDAGFPGLVKAVRWMLPYYEGRQAWSWNQIVPFKKDSAVYLLNLAAQGSGDEQLREAADYLTVHAWSRITAWRSGLRSFEWSGQGLMAAV